LFYKYLVLAIHHIRSLKQLIERISLLFLPKLTYTPIKKIISSAIFLSIFTVIIFILLNIYGN